MSVVIQAGGGRQASGPRAYMCVLQMVVGVLFATVCLTSAPAWSFEVTTTVQSGVAAPIVSVPEEPSGDSCLYILRAARERAEVTSRHNEYRQSAGSAAALGLVFGVRFALGPGEVTKVRRRGTQPVASFGMWEPRESTGGGQALAIADYRACRNENALRTLTD